VRHRLLGARHLHAARNEKSERERQEQALIDGALEEEAHEAIEIHRMADLGCTVARAGDGEAGSLPGLGPFVQRTV
jgi:hypothetical protein